LKNTLEQHTVMFNCKYCTND